MSAMLLVFNMYNHLVYFFFICEDTRTLNCMWVVEVGECMWVGGVDEWEGDKRFRNVANERWELKYNKQ